jgi:DNA phosphorothioation-dependent restriction protein DptG
MSATPRQTNENRKSARLVNIAQTTAGSRMNMNSNAAVFLKIRCDNERPKLQSRPNVTQQFQQSGVEFDRRRRHNYCICLPVRLQ